MQQNSRKKYDGLHNYTATFNIIFLKVFFNLSLGNFPHNWAI